MWRVETVAKRTGVAMARDSSKVATTFTAVSAHQLTPPPVPPPHRLTTLVNHSNEPKTVVSAWGRGRGGDELRRGNEVRRARRLASLPALCVRAPYIPLPVASTTSGTAISSPRLLDPYIKLFKHTQHVNDRNQDTNW
ncbi:hypothetical protein RR46_02072 [Papilio xuthus]|uniref:Uncharacterized protein n=1 Tax=Papilio xuthus TaxID=66420 RepID=A0A194QPM8_PAPXU|nr:hypothetical protein RR46_02072 [Papilio xuthus]